MGFPEGRKLARDVNKNSDECTERLSSLLEQTGLKLDMANRTLERVAGEEDRHVYIASETNQLCSLQSETYTWSDEGAYNFTCDQTFTAGYNGVVSLKLDCYGNFNEIAGGINITYIITQIYPQNTRILTGSSYSDVSGGFEGANFAVIKNGVYRVDFLVETRAYTGQNWDLSGSLNSYIYGEIVFKEGSSTKYYYPAEGAPAIWSDSGTYELTGDGSGNKQSVIEDFFLSDLDGAVIVSFDVETYSMSSGEQAYFALLPDISDWIYNNSGGHGFGIDELSESASTNSKASFVTTVEKGKQYSLLSNISYKQSLTISNISVSAIKTTTAPITVPFVSVDEPIACTYNFGHSSKQGYILKKLPESIYEKSYNYLIAMQNDVYPGKNADSADLMFFNMNTMSPDYYVRYNTNDSDWVERNSNRIGEFSANNIFAVAVVNGEICVCGTPGNNYVTLADLVRSCPPVSATLY